MREDTKVVVDDTTIYEIDLNCYDCLSEQERQEYFPNDVWGIGTRGSGVCAGAEHTQRER